MIWNNLTFVLIYNKDNKNWLWSVFFAFFKVFEYNYSRFLIVQFLFMTLEQRQQIETQIKNDFSELQKKLGELQNEIKNESDENKKKEKQAEYRKLLEELKVIEQDMRNIESRNEEEVLALKNTLELTKKTYQEIQWELADLVEETQESVEKKSDKLPTLTTYELLKDSETCSRLLNIISSNPDSFKDLPWDTAEKKLEYVFEKIRAGIVLFMKNKLWNSENIKKVINNTIAPAFEWSLMELLRDQGNEANISMLRWMDKISLNSLKKLIAWIWNFAHKTTWSYNKFNQWLNAIDYLSVHNWVFRYPNKSEVLSNPLRFQQYMNDAVFDPKDEKWNSISFSPYVKIDKNIFMMDEKNDFDLWISLKEKKEILSEIWDIQVVNSPKTTALIAKMVNKPEEFLQKTQWFQETANNLLDWISSLNSVTKMFWVDILWEIIKAPENRSFPYKILDFLCKLTWITWWLEWIIKRWRLDRMNLTDEKNENISQIMKEYQKSSWENMQINIIDEDSCKMVLKDFEVTENQPSNTKWDYLRDSIVNNMDISLISPVVVQQILWNSYLKKETIQENWQTKESFIVDESKFTEYDKLTLVHNHLISMKSYLEKYDNLKDFYMNVHSTEDIALCITASLYADKDDVIEWVKTRVFLPENYGLIHSDWTIANYKGWWGENLDSRESSDKQQVSEQWIYDKAMEYGITDNRQIAYVLSTVKWESDFKNQKEIWWEDRDYWQIDSETKQAYYGRWFIQLTHKSNYERYTHIINDSWKDFKDNNWNILRWTDIDLVNNPDIILQSNDLAAFIMLDWMKNWWPDRLSKRRLDYFINDNNQDYYHARSIINWMNSNPGLYADNAVSYLNKLSRA